MVLCRTVRRVQRRLLSWSCDQRQSTIIFWQCQTFHEDPKESYGLVENGHPMTLLKLHFFHPSIYFPYYFILCRVTGASALIHFICIENSNPPDYMNVPFVFHRRKKVTWIWNDMSVSKWSPYIGSTRDGRILFQTGPKQSYFGVYPAKICLAVCKKILPDLYKLNPNLHMWFKIRLISNVWKFWKAGTVRLDFCNTMHRAQSWWLQLSKFTHLCSHVVYIIIY